jgi:mitochondrial fission protein ELM1
VTTRCWVLTEGHIGMENQALGVAEALGAAVTIKRLHPRAPWKWLPPRLWVAPLRAPGPKGDALEPPWPDLVISCGKRAVAPALAIKRASGGRCFAVHIQVPPVPPERFDLVVVPEHDALRGPNVLVTRAAVHRVTPEKLTAEAARLAPTVAHLPRPLVTVLIGGANGRYRLTPAIARRLGEQLRALAESGGAGLLVTPSRRTGAENEAALREGLGDAPALVWDHQGDNPYFGWLGLADHIVVTCDSVSMTSEALATGKPVHVVPLEGSSKRIDRFHATLRDAGLTRRFEGRLDSWTYDPPNDTALVAEAIATRLRERQPDPTD